MTVSQNRNYCLGHFLGSRLKGGGSLRIPREIETKKTLAPRECSGAEPCVTVFKEGLKQLGVGPRRQRGLAREAFSENPRNYIAYAARFIIWSTRQRTVYRE